jgi:hypothetical protein
VNISPRQRVSLSTLPVEPEVAAVLDEARLQCPEKRLSVAELPIHDVPWDGSVSLRRKHMYADDGR